MISASILSEAAFALTHLYEHSTVITCVFHSVNRSVNRDALSLSLSSMLNVNFGLADG